MGEHALRAILARAIERDAAGLHLKPGSPPLLRVHGRLSRLAEITALTVEETEDFLAQMLARLPSTRKEDEFDRTGEVDFAHVEEGLGRFRVTAYRQRGNVSLVVRPVPDGVPALEALGLPEVVASIADETDGLVLVTGPGGSGATTTLAALVDTINRRHERNIITIEDPIEVVHRDVRSAVNQREIGLDTISYADALARVGRHDPDVVLVGDLPDAATVEAALAVAEAGALVLSVVRSTYPGEALARLVGMFPAERQEAVRIALAANLRALIVQHLLPRVDRGGRVAAVGVLLGGPELREAVASGLDPESVHSVALAGAARGAQSLEDVLSELISSGTIEVASALRLARDPRTLHQAPDVARVAALLDWDVS